MCGDYRAITCWRCTDSECQLTCVNCCPQLWGMKGEKLHFRSESMCWISQQFTLLSLCLSTVSPTDGKLGEISHCLTSQIPRYDVCVLWPLPGLTAVTIEQTVISLSCVLTDHWPLMCVTYSWGDLSKCLLTLDKEPMTDESEDACKAQQRLWVPLWGVIWVTNMSIGKQSLIGADKIQRQLNHQKPTLHGWGLTS